jgi:hypothetical protein
MKPNTPGYEFYIPEENLARFQALLEKDKSENLIARYNYFLEANEDLVRRRLGFVPIIYEYYWACIFIEPDRQNKTPFAYSIGLFYEFAHPEVILIGGDLNPDQYKYLINEIGCHVRDKGPLFVDKDYRDQLLPKSTTKIEDTGDDIVHIQLPYDEGVFPSLKAPLIFREYDATIENQFPCGFLYSFYRNFADMGDLRPPVLVADLR